jgi:CheY-like chemotaxis protein
VSLAGARIVVIDDDRDVRDGMGAILRTWGCEVVAAATGEETLRAVLPQRLPSLLIVDYRLGPGATGVDVARTLLHAWGAAIPILIISGESSEGELGRIRDSGFPFLQKPVPPAKLRSLLTHLLGGGAR